jgi:hypothetical protein
VIASSLFDANVHTLTHQCLNLQQQTVPIEVFHSKVNVHDVAQIYLLFLILRRALLSSVHFGGGGHIFFLSVVNDCLGVRCDELFHLNWVFRAKFIRYVANFDCIVAWFIVDVIDALLFPFD